MREKAVRVSEQELQELKQYRREAFDPAIPLGYVVQQLVTEAQEGDDDD